MCNVETFVSSVPYDAVVRSRVEVRGEALLCAAVSANSDNLPAGSTCPRWPEEPRILIFKMRSDGLKLLGQRSLVRDGDQQGHK